MAHTPLPGHIPIRMPGVVCHLLHDEQGVVLIDTGLMGVPGRVKRIMQRLDRPMSDLRAILLTHGHLDHTGGAAKLQRSTGATVHCHRDDIPHVQGRYPYEGIARVCGALEGVGRWSLRYTPPTVGGELDDGDELPFWAGLRVVHLPGHTAGHCGFYSERHDALFVGDLFASYLKHAHRPPPFLNSCPQHFPHSFERVKHLCPQWLIPNHYAWWSDYRAHRNRFEHLCRHVLRSTR